MDELQKAAGNAELLDIQGSEQAALVDSLQKALRTIADLMAQNTQAMGQLALQQKIQSDCMEALARQLRMNTLVTNAQVRYINEAIRNRAKELLVQRGLDADRALAKRLGNSIRKSVLARYGAASLREIPAHEYSVVMEQIKTWSDLLILRDVVRAARQK